MNQKTKKRKKEKGKRCAVSAVFGLTKWKSLYLMTDRLRGWENGLVTLHTLNQLRGSQWSHCDHHTCPKEGVAAVLRFFNQMISFLLLVRISKISSYLVNLAAVSCDHSVFNFFVNKKKVGFSFLDLPCLHPLNLVASSSNSCCVPFLSSLRW